MNLTLTGFAIFAFFINSYFLQPHIKSPNLAMKSLGSSLAFGLLFSILHAVLIKQGFMSFEGFGVGARRHGGGSRSGSPGTGTLTRAR